MYEPEVDDRVVVNLLTSMTTCLLINVQDLMPKHSFKRGRVKAVEDSIKNLAKLHSAPLSTKMVAIGVRVWNRCMDELETGLLEASFDETQQPSLLYVHENVAPDPRGWTP